MNVCCDIIVIIAYSYGERGQSQARVESCVKTSDLAANCNNVEEVFCLAQSFLQHEKQK
jgi:predicted nucleic acid binding AN1-type Zn finger protein